MKLIESKIKYYELLMCYESASKYINYELPNIYVYYNGKSYEYEYFENDNKIILEEINYSKK